MRLLITGGNGFIGIHLISYLLRYTSHQIFNIDKIEIPTEYNQINKIQNNLSSRNRWRYNFIQYDLCKTNGLNKLISDISPDLIMHLAAETHVDKSIKYPKLFFDNNILATFNLLESAFTYWKNLPIDKRLDFKFHQISTDEVFGELSDKGVFNESSPYQPRSPYSASKASADHLVKSWYTTYGFPVVITYSSNNYGPIQSPDKFIPLIINNILGSNKIPIYGNGLNIRNWLFVEDHVDALWLVAEKGKIGEVYCIGGEDEVDNLTLVDLICREIQNCYNTSVDVDGLIEYVDDRLGHDFRYSLDSSKIKMELEWRPKFNLSEGIKTTIKWYMDNKNWVSYMRMKM